MTGIEVAYTPLMGYTMFRVVTFGIIFFVLYVQSFELKTTPVIKTHKGPVRGKILQTPWEKVSYSAILGIPYAKPPVGHRRFKPPEEPELWNEVLEGFTYGSVCPQLDFIYNTFTGSEDCLYLNVYTPEIAFGKDMRNSLKPVMVFIYGGSFSSGYSNGTLYGPDFMIEDNVVVVTFNYRLGAAGFLSLEHVNASGNAGLKDQHLALKWVQKNIANFGGNPGQVTLFGQSAGGVAVDFHMLSKKSQGLFQRSISMSASALTLWGFHTSQMANERARSLGNKLGCNTGDTDELLSCLINANIEDIVTATEKLTLIDLPFKPTLETNPDVPDTDKIIQECSFNKYLTGDFVKQPHLMGFEKNEALYFSKPLLNLGNALNEPLNRILSYTEMPVLKQLSIPVTMVIANIRDMIMSFIMSIIYFLTDVLFLAPIDLKQNLLAQQNPYPIYYYAISYDSMYDWHEVFRDIDVRGPAHGDDLGYIFRTTLADIPLNPSLPYNIFRKKMVRLWTNFAKYANPTPRGMNDPLLNVTWPDSRDAGMQLDINQDLVMKKRQINNLTKTIENLSYQLAPYYTECSHALDVIQKIL